MKLIRTDKISPRQLSDQETYWVYNGLDCCVTAEVLEVLLPQLNQYTSKTYDFSRSLQGPVLDMRLRGIRIDLAKREKVLDEYEDTLLRLERNLERIVIESTGLNEFRWTAPGDLRNLFFNVFKITPQVFTEKGTPSVNRAVLESLEFYTIARPIVNHMKALRDIKKRIDVVSTELDDDGRIRTSYNIAGTNTGRFSSSFSEFGTGGNLQNIEEGLRSMFIADEGMKMANFDAEQGESRCVGAIEWNIFRNGKYLDACESGDLHTAVARICWGGLPWSGDPDEDRRLADQQFYRHHSRRHMCKILGHGTNYGGRPQTLHAQTKVDFPIIVDFQEKYFKAFPAHQMWHAWVGEQIRSFGKLVSLTERQRHFFGRRDDDRVIRQALDFDPQCSLSDIVNQGMLNVWLSNSCQLLMQSHDSILVQYPQEEEDEVIPKIQSQLHHELQLKYNRTLTIPYGCKTGWNWGEFSKTNPDGLKEYRPGDQRTRTS